MDNDNDNDNALVGQALIAESIVLSTIKGKNVGTGCFGCLFTGLTAFEKRL